ncbi:putative beta-hexosaminidase [Aspergillus japonicus CBS 114.51]|uniref:beta-N-acetylhexosaminidase n=2 Tax=Aspergillus TaxID=5052 RepID=A0A2V5H495_ASPV1|nr:putative beta-hexosaminidase [Aspergillus japonicus CBS 114.51]PYI18879.1 putative beta-hexosaminidase [Aspergillus violaceofuscus CBS 115571]RAH77845.1 putative beta-hexosaminidase [Aspergillus japonicus CBS 114.51]
MDEDSDLYPHRGFMLDTGRKFFPVNAILDLLTVLHEHRFNVFHWHIYDAESFPLHWPADRGLTDTSIRYSHTRDYYTPSDIQTVVNYAQSLAIQVYPETDMPGHSDIWYVSEPEEISWALTPDLQHLVAQLDIRNAQLHAYIADLVTTVDQYFQSPHYHHFGADEVAYIWGSDDDNRLFANYLHWLRCLRPNKSAIQIDLATDWIIQTWHSGVTQEVLRRGHRVIVSESDTFYIGNADADKISKFAFPDDANVLGFEVVWFISQGDDSWDFRQNWVMQPIKVAAQIRRQGSNRA